MTKSEKMVLLSLTLMLATAGGISAAAADPGAKRVVVGRDITLPPKLQRYRANVWDEIESAARDSGWTAIKAEDGASSCGVKDCPREIADREKVATVLSVEGSYTNAGYSITVKLWGRNVRNGQDGWTAQFASSCELCSGPEFAGTVGINVRKALVAEAERLAAAPAPLPNPGPLTQPGRIDGIKPPNPAQTQPAGVAAQSPASPPPERIIAPWVLVGAGALVTGIGVGLWAVDGKQGGACWSSTCGKVYSTRGIGIAGTGIGVAAILAGGGWYIYKVREQGSVAVGPGTISVAGRF